MKAFKRIISIIVTVALIASLAIVTSFSTSASSTGAGLAEWALRAYNDGWSYVYGGASVGAVDCSGLIYAYCGGARGGNSQFNAASQTGYLSGRIPNIHGLCVYQDGHVGVYVGGGMAVDARGDDYGVCYQSVYTKSWTHWYKNSAVSYTTEGWEKFNGNYYYYENGEYITDTSRTIDGVTYYFDANGASSTAPSSNSSSGSSSSNTSSSSGPRTLKRGSSGDDVIKLQNRLTELGFYNGDITGYFGELTEAAYIDFQTTAGVYVDGISGASDQQLLYSDNAPYKKNKTTSEITITKKEKTNLAETSSAKSYRLGDTDEKIGQIQERLSQLGYYNGEINNEFDDKTLTAFDLFQSVNSVAQTGYADTFSQEVLFSIAAISNPNPLTDDDSNFDEEQTQNGAEDSQTEENAKDEKAQNSDNNNAAQTSTENVIETSADVVLETTKVSNKALQGLTNDANFTNVESPENNFGFMIWLAVMLVVVLITFIVIYIREKKKKVARRARIKARRYAK